MKIPMNNLSQGGFKPSSLTPGVSGESVNAPYGPKAVDECGMDSIPTEYNPKASNHTLHGDFSVGKTSGPAQNSVGGLHEEFDDSSLKP